MRLLAGLATLALAAASGAPIHAAEACNAYMMDVDNELRLFNEAPDPLDAGRDAASAPAIEPDRLYAVKLQSQQQVRYVAPPGRKPIDPAKTGGLLRFSVAEAGSWRIAVDASFWIDVLHDGKALTSTDSRGDHECAGPQKIVTFDLPAGVELIVQLADVGVGSVRLTLTAAPPKVW